MPPSSSATTINIGGRSLLMVGFRQYLMERALDNDKYSTRLNSPPITRPNPVDKSTSTSSVPVIMRDVWSSHYQMETKKRSGSDPFLEHETNARASMNPARSERDWQGLDVRGSKTSNFKRHGEKEGKTDFDVLGGSEGDVYPDTNERVSMDLMKVNPSYTSRLEMGWYRLDVRGSNTSNFKGHGEEESKTNCDIHELGSSEGDDQADTNVHVDNGSKTYRVHRNDVNVNGTCPDIGSLSSHFDNGTHRANGLTFSASNDETELEDRNYNTEQINVLDLECGHVFFNSLDETISSNFQYKKDFKDASELQENGVNESVDEFTAMNLRYTSSPKASRTVKRGMDESGQDFDESTTYHTYARIGESTITEDSACGREDRSNISCSSPTCEYTSQNFSHIYAQIGECTIIENSACDMSHISCSNPTCECKSRDHSHIYARIAENPITEDSSCSCEDMSNTSCSNPTCECKSQDHSHIYARIDENMITEDSSCGSEEMSSSCSNCEYKLRKQPHIYEDLPVKASAYSGEGEKNVSKHFYRETYENLAVRKFVCQENSAQFPNAEYYSKNTTGAVGYLHPRSDMHPKMEQSKYIFPAKGNNASYLCDLNVTTYDFPSASSRSADRERSKDNSAAEGNNTTYLCDVNSTTHEFPSASSFFADRERSKDKSPAEGNNATHLRDVNGTTYDFPSAISFSADRERSKDNSAAEDNNATYLCDVNGATCDFPSASSFSADRERSKDDSAAEGNNATHLCDVNGAIYEFPSGSSYSTVRDRSKDNPAAEDNDTTYLCDTYDTINEFPATNSDSRNISMVPQPIHNDDNYTTLLPSPTFSCCDCLRNEDACSCSFSSWSCQAQEGSPSRSNNSATYSSSPSFEISFCSEVLGHTYCELDGAETGLDGASSSLNLIEPSYVRIGDTVGGIVNPYCVVDVPMYAETGFSGELAGIDTYSTASTTVAPQMCPDDYSRLVVPSPRRKSDARKGCLKSVQISVGILYVTVLLSILLLVVYAIYRSVTWLS